MVLIVAHNRINAILIYRFLLDLHETNEALPDEELSGLDIIGSLGSISFIETKSSRDSRDDEV